MQQKNERIEILDSVRGIAALQVVIHHSMLIVPVFWASVHGSWNEAAGVSQVFIYSPLHFFWVGHEPVILFFVLSGFVLTIPYTRTSLPDYKSFFVKRFFRIYMPYVTALLLGAAGNMIFNDHARISGLSDWFNDIWNSPIEASDWKDYFLLFPGNFHNIVTSLWTIPVEIKISFVFPLFLLLLRKTNKLFSVLFVLFNIVFFMMGKRMGASEVFGDFDLFYYLTFFLVGALLCKYKADLTALVDRLSRVQLASLAICAILLYTYRWNIELFPSSITEQAKKFPADYAACFAASIFIIVVISNRAPGWLNHKYLVFLGKISFSLYLIHPVIIGVFGFLLGGKLPFFLLVSLSILVSLLLAIPFSRYIEGPFQTLGKYISERMKKRKLVPTDYGK